MLRTTMRAVLTIRDSQKKRNPANHFAFKRYKDRTQWCEPLKNLRIAIIANRSTSRIPLFYLLEYKCNLLSSQHFKLFSRSYFTMDYQTDCNSLLCNESKVKLEERLKVYLEYKVHLIIIIVVIIVIIRGVIIIIIVIIAIVVTTFVVTAIVVTAVVVTAIICWILIFSDA